MYTFPLARLRFWPLHPSVPAPIQLAEVYRVTEYLADGKSFDVTLEVSNQKRKAK